MKNWRDYTLQRDATLRDAIAVLEINQCSVIVDPKDQIFTSNSNFSDPKVSSLSWVTNLKVKFAVLPNNFLILIGSSRPGNSTKILSFPLLKILGSFVPISSTLLLTISIAWFCDEVLICINPYFE